MGQRARLGRFDFFVVTLAPIGFGNVTENLFDVSPAPFPGWFPAFRTRHASAHGAILIRMGQHALVNCGHQEIRLEGLCDVSVKAQ